MKNVISVVKFNEITHAIGQLQDIIGYTDDARERVFSRYSAEVVAAYKSKCAELDARDGEGTAEWTY
jgi:hypothetical protein